MGCVAPKGPDDLNDTFKQRVVLSPRLVSAEVTSKKGSLLFSKADQLISLFPFCGSHSAKEKKKKIPPPPLSSPFYFQGRLLNSVSFHFSHISQQKLPLCRPSIVFFSHSVSPCVSGSLLISQRSPLLRT